MINTFNWKELSGSNLAITYAEDIEWDTTKSPAVGVKVETAIGFDKRTGKYYVLNVNKRDLGVEL